MSLIEDVITGDGAVISVFLGVSQNREAVLRRAGFPVPARVSLRLLIDTGSFATGVPSMRCARWRSKRSIRYLSAPPRRAKGNRTSRTSLT
jgi:hypothetical protein